MSGWLFLGQCERRRRTGPGLGVPAGMHETNLKRVIQGIGEVRHEKSKRSVKSKMR
jgi:hypothetical protein